MGKGSKRRPGNEKAVRENWGQIFTDNPVSGSLKERQDPWERMQKDRRSQDDR